MSRSRIFAVCAIALAGAALLAPANSQQQTPPANGPALAAQSPMLEQPRAAQSAQKSEATPTGAETPAAVTPGDPPKQCVRPDEFAVELRSGRNRVGAPIVLATNFLPTNQRVDVGVRAPFVDGVRYFAGIDYGEETYLFKRQDPGGSPDG